MRTRVSAPAPPVPTPSSFPSVAPRRVDDGPTRRFVQRDGRRLHVVACCRGVEVRGCVREPRDGGGGIAVLQCVTSALDALACGPERALVRLSERRRLGRCAREMARAVERRRGLQAVACVEARRGHAHLCGKPFPDLRQTVGGRLRRLHAIGGLKFDRSDERDHAEQAKKTNARFHRLRVANPRRSRGSRAGFDCGCDFSSMCSCPWPCFQPIATSHQFIGYVKTNPTRRPSEPNVQNE